MSAAIFDATYVINLDRSPERWASAQRVAGLAGLPNIVRVPGFDGRQLDDAAIVSLQETGRLARDLSAFDPRYRTAEIGCGLSHARVLHDIIERGWQRALVLEDDIELTGSSDDWPARLRAAFADLPADWELWYLHRCFDIRHRVERLSPRTVIPWTPQSGAAYAVTARGARTLLEAITPLARAVDLTYVEVVKSRRLNSFAASPMLFDPGLGSQPSVLRTDAPDQPWMDHGINRPPEYWPARYLPYLGEAPSLRSTLAEWRHYAGAALRRLRPRGEAGE